MGRWGGATEVSLSRGTERDPSWPCRARSSGDARLSRREHGFGMSLAFVLEARS